MCCFAVILELRFASLLLHNSNGNVKAIYYDYSVCVEDDKKYVITYFWPDRFKFNKNAIDNCMFILNKVVLDKKLCVNEDLLS